MRDFTGVRVFPYRGVPPQQLLHVGGPGGTYGSTITATFSDYAALSNMGISVNLFATTHGPAISRIASVYIDNTANPFAVYIAFADTRMIVTCAPYSTLYSPVLTNQTNFVMYAFGLITNQPSTLNVIVLDKVVDGFEAYELPTEYPKLISSSFFEDPAAQLIGSDFFSPSLGDQSQTLLFSASGGVNPTVFGGAAAGLIFVKGWTAHVVNSGGTASAGARIDFADASGLEIITQFVWGWTAAGTGNTLVFPAISGLDVRLDATVTWKLLIKVPSNGVNTFAFTVVYTQNNNLLN